MKGKPWVVLWLPLAKAADGELLTMKFTGALVSIEMDMADYRQRLHESLSEEIAHVASVWLEAVLQEIPIWSGASWATFTKLSREIGSTLAISPAVKSRISYGQRHGDGALTANKKKVEYTFEYSTDLRWLVHNEFNTPESDPNVFAKLKKPGPYHFQRIGRAAFEKHAADVRLPNPWKSLKVTRHRI